MQVFLTFCTLVTIYFAEEVPLAVKEPHHLSDAAPLLEDQQQNGIELSKLKHDIPTKDGTNGKNTMGGHEGNTNLKHAKSKVEEDQNSGLSDGPGAVLVNLLTSLRHLPPAMHSVLIVMALSWVSATDDKYIMILSYDNVILVSITCVLFSVSKYYLVLITKLFYVQLSWFPFFLFDTDWMGREVYHGDPKGNVAEVEAYDQGVREGAYGLLLNSVRTQI